MSVIKTENLDVYALIDRNNFVVSVLLDGATLATFEYPIADLATDIVGSLCDDRGFITGEDAADAFETIDALEGAIIFINNYIED